MKKPKIIYCGFRKWSLDIFNYVQKEYSKKIDLILIKSNQEFEDLVVYDKLDKCDLIFFIGWSLIIDKIIVDNYKCICLHPSPLPKYRGGSPLQHQIINGETRSAVTYFIMNDKIDQGDILFQSEFSLAGNLDTVYNRITHIGQIGIDMILSQYLSCGKLNSTPQTESEKTYYKRRTPAESELYSSDFDTAEKAYNKIRALQNPYPNAFIKCKDGTKLYITDTHLG